jgi:transposase
MAFAAATHSRDLTDEQWDLIGRFLPEPVRRADGRGRPWKENRAVLNGILWILRTGAPWADLPDRYPSYQTCHRRFQQWVRVGVLRSILEILAQALHDEGYLDLQEAFIDGSFAPAKQGGARVGKTKRGKGSKIMAIADRQGLPVAVHVESATPHEVTLVHATLAQRFVNQLPVRLIGDNAYESDRLDAELARRGVELIAPHRRTRTQRTQDGRPLRRYQRRWKVERLFAWFQNFRRIVVRYERLAENFLGMLQLASCLILLRGYEMASKSRSDSLGPLGDIATDHRGGTHCALVFLNRDGSTSRPLRQLTASSLSSSPGRPATKAWRVASRTRAVWSQPATAAGKTA